MRASLIVGQPGRFLIQGDPGSQVVASWDQQKLCWIYADPETRFTYELPLDWLRDPLDFYLPRSPLHGLEFTPVQPPKPETFGDLLTQISQPPTPIDTSPTASSSALPREPSITEVLFGPEIPETIAPPIAPPAPCPIMSTNTIKLEVPKLKPYHGERSKYDVFLVNLKHYFALSETTDATKKIYTALLLLQNSDDTTDTCVDAFKRKIDGLTPFPATWTAFEKLLEEEFDEPAKEENTYAKLCGLRPAASELMSDYVSCFVTL